MSLFNLYKNLLKFGIFCGIQILVNFFNFMMNFDEFTKCVLYLCEIDIYEIGETLPQLQFKYNKFVKTKVNNNF